MSSQIYYDVTPGMAFVLPNYPSTMVLSLAPTPLTNVSVSDDGMIK